MVTFAPLMMVATFGSWLIRKIDPNESVTPGPGGTAGKTNVRLWTGLPSESCADFEGNAPSVAVYGEEGHLLGKVKGSGKENGVWTLHPGELHDYSLSVENESIARPTYIQIDASGNDGLCITAIEVTSFDGFHYIIYGDIPFHMCGWPGYPSIADFPPLNIVGEGYRPACIWLDGDSSWTYGLPRSFHFHLPDFEAQNRTVDAYNDNPALLCKSQGRMGMTPWPEATPDRIPYFSPPLNYDADKGNHLDPMHVLDEIIGVWPLTNKKGYKRRDLKGSSSAKEKRGCGIGKRATDRQESRWVASWSPQDASSAEYICGLPNAIGPHYANLHDGKFCNMDDRTVWDICAGNNTSNCFDTEKQVLYGPSTGTASNDTSETLSDMANQLLQLTSRIDMASRK